MAAFAPARSGSFRERNSLTRRRADGNVVCRANLKTEEAPGRGQHQVRHQADEAERATSSAKPCCAERHPFLAEGSPHRPLREVSGFEGQCSRSHPHPRSSSQPRRHPPEYGSAQEVGARSLAEHPLLIPAKTSPARGRLAQPP